MRPLTLIELEDELSKHSRRIESSDFETLIVLLKQFFDLLYSQPISKRILDKISEDFNFIEEKIPVIKAGYNSDYKDIKAVNEVVVSWEGNGALGYFILSRLLKYDNLDYGSLFNFVNDWFDLMGDYYQGQRNFNSRILKPFEDLMLWYFRESVSNNSEDYFSKKEIVDMSKKMDDLLREIRYGQNILYNDIKEGFEDVQKEFEELKELLQLLKKKNWKQIVSGKLIDLTLAKTITSANCTTLYKHLTDIDWGAIGEAFNQSAIN